MRYSELLESDNNDILKVLNLLKAQPFHDKIKVFGSFATKVKTPGDIDFFVDLSDVKYVDITQLNEYSVLLNIARKYYGLVDPFLRFSNNLLVRNDNATGWVIAKNKKGLIGSMDRDAIALTDVVFSIPEDATAGAVASGDVATSVSSFMAPVPKSKKKKSTIIRR